MWHNRDISAYSRLGLAKRHTGAAMLQILLAAFVVVPPALAEPSPQQRLSATEHQLSQSRSRTAELRAQETAIDGELKGLRDKMIAAAAAADRSEKDLAELESNLADLEGTAARRAVQLAAQRQQLSETLALMQRLALTPPAAQLFSDTPPLNRLRSDLQLKALLPEIDKRSAELAATVADMRLLQQRLEDKRQRTLAEKRSLARQQKDLDSLMDERSRRLASTRSLYTREQQRAERLASQAQNLRDLLDKLEEESRNQPQEDAAPAIQPRALPATATRRLPVAAPAIARFGEPDSFGNTSKGIVLRPRPGAVVSSVAAGRIAFAGPFRGYGRVLIVDHNGLYHTVLAGLGRVTVEVGQRVEAGEPLGTISGQQEPPPELYYEVRRKGVPVDPLGSQAAQLTQSRSP